MKISLNNVLATSIAVLAISACTHQGASEENATFSREALVKLGERLFFDRRLSKDEKLSCGSCHVPEFGFTDRKTLAEGFNGQVLQRHTPHLFNLKYGSSFFWDGRSASLEEQALLPIINKKEMAIGSKELTKRLRQDSDYVTAFNKVFPSSGVTAKNFAKAIAAYERTIVAEDTLFDRNALGDQSVFTESQIRGKKLFFSAKTKCNTCHKGPNFTDGDFHNTGISGDDPGRSGVDRVGNFRMRPYPFFQTQNAFKTPGLRNVTLTSPYMHNGIFTTLEEVIDHFNSGGDRNSYGLSFDIKPLHLSEQEKSDLVAFLGTLTSPTVYTTPEHVYPPLVDSGD